MTPHELDRVLRLIRDDDSVRENVAIFDHVRLVGEVEGFDFDANASGHGGRHAGSKPKPRWPGKSAGVGSFVREKRDDCVFLAACVFAAELDERPCEISVEVEIGKQVGFVLGNSA
jgi:hypothetical protein